jgi:hypothetical protein
MAINFEDILNHKYEPSRVYAEFHIAGFTYGDGIDVVNDLEPGVEVQLVGEPDNPYDPEAVAIFFEGKRLGYVPKNHNSQLSQLLYFGHSGLFEAKINYKNDTEHPERQLRVVVRVKDIRKTRN